MIQDNAILDELKALNSPLAGYSRTMPYALPSEYFNWLADTLATGVVYAESGDPVMAFSRKMPFIVPEGYLAALPDSLMDAAHKEAEIQPAIAMPYGAPDGYFEALPNALLAAAKAADKPVKKGKTIAFNPAWQKDALRWAAAAVLVMSVWLGTYRYMHPAAPDAVATKQLAQLDGNAINTYIDQNMDEFDTETLEASVAAANTDLHTSISSLNDDEIENYLDDDAKTTGSKHLN